MQRCAVWIIVIFTLGLRAAPLPAYAKQAEKVYRIGYLGGGRGNPALLNPFRQGLRDLGYVEGQNIIIEWRFAQQRNERLPGLAAELVQMHLDVLLGTTDPVVSALKEATTTIPIVAIASHDLVKAGFAETMARPGGNITGLSAHHLDIGLKYLELL